MLKGNPVTSTQPQVTGPELDNNCVNFSDLAGTVAFVAILTSILQESMVLPQLKNGFDQRDPLVDLNAEILLMNHYQLVKPTINEYTVLLGQGSSTTVTLHRLRSSIDSLVAVKRLSANQPKSVLMDFIKEANLLRKLIHCAVFPELIGFINHNGTPSMVLEFVGDWYKLTSVSVFDAMRWRRSTNRRLLASEWVAVGRDVADGLSILHFAGYLHTDLHDKNIMLCRYPEDWNPDPRITWVAKITGLDAAQPIDEPPPPLRLSEEEKATYRKYQPHQAPELVDGISGPTIASDVYAYGRLIDDIGVFGRINILCCLARKCLNQSPRLRLRRQITTIAKELSNHVDLYQTKEETGVYNYY